MYLNTQGVRENLRLMFKRPSFLRLLSTLTIGAAFVVVRTSVWLARGLDRVVFRGLKTQKVERPIFIFANPRSGTTLLHRLLSMDEERFSTVALYQTIFPAAVFTKIFRGLGRFMNTWLGAPLRLLFQFFNAPFASRWQGVHELNLGKPEEDECVFLFAQQTPTMGLLLPFIDEMPSQMTLDGRPERERRRFMDYYEETIKRVLHADGGDKRFLNKNVFFSTRIRTMYERFPDATFVYLVRNPYDAVPSFLNMYHRAWTSHSGNKIAVDSPEYAALMRMGFGWYHQALESRKHIPKNRFITIRYEDLVSDLRGTVDTLYQRLGIDMGADFAAKLEACVKEHEAYERPNHYSLKQFGLTRQDIYNELKDVFDEFGYEPPMPVPYVEAAE